MKLQVWGDLQDLRKDSGEWFFCYAWPFCPLLRDYLFAILLIGQENVPLLNCQIRIIHEGIYLEVLLESPEINVRRSDCDKTVIDDKCLSKLEAEANKAIEMIREVDALRQTTSEKLQKANEQLTDVKELAMGYRQTIKNNYPMEQWYEALNVWLTTLIWQTSFTNTDFYCTQFAESTENLNFAGDNENRSSYE